MVVACGQSQLNASCQYPNTGPISHGLLKVQSGDVSVSLSLLA